MDTLRSAVVDSFEGRQLPWVAELVEAPSCTRERDDVEAAAKILDRTARELGLRVRTIPDPEGRYADHRVYETPACGETALALVGHVDTVFPRAMGFFGFTRDGDAIRGPGVLDMKSGLSSIFFALRALREAEPQAYEALSARVIVVSDEEVGSPSSTALYRELAPRTSAALVFEAGRTGDRIVTRRKGGAVFEIEAHGRSAHAGNQHEAGISAVHALALKVPVIEALTDYPRGVTVNVGVFTGGTAKNTVPDHARIEIDGRFLALADGPWLERALAEIAQAPIDAPPKLRDVRFRFAGGITRPPMEADDRTQALRARYERHARAAGLQIGEAPLQGGGSDANLLSAHGVACIDGLGPYGQHFHRREEWASVSSLRARTEALAAFLREEAAPDEG